MPYYREKWNTSFGPNHSLFFFEEECLLLEKHFQRRLIKKVKKEFPGCVVLKTDPNYIQGFPDLLILHGPHWAALEVKKERGASHRPNQDFYVRKLNMMSYASFAYPENEREIMHALRKTFGTGRRTRVSESEQLPLG